MKTGLFAVLAFALALNASAFAEDKAEDQKKKQEMMQEWMKFATPGEGHKFFKDVTGSWTYTSLSWEKKDAKPNKSKGTSTIRLIMGGRYLEQTAKGNMMGMPFEGRGFTGYNNATGKYESTWMDNMSTSMMVGKGSYDKETKTLKDEGEFYCPMNKKNVDYHSEWKMADKNHMTFAMWGPDMDGEEIKMFELSYTRAGAK